MQVKLQPIRLNSWEPHPARLYAWRQMELMRKGLSKRKAQAEVQKQYEAEMAAKRCGLTCCMGCLHRPEQPLHVPAVRELLAV